MTSPFRCDIRLMTDDSAYTGCFIPLSRPNWIFFDAAPLTARLGIDFGYRCFANVGLLSQKNHKGVQCWYEVIAVD
jgi:hypothetical protein